MTRSKPRIKPRRKNKPKANLDVRDVGNLHARNNYSSWDEDMRHEFDRRDMLDMYEAGYHYGRRDPKPKREASVELRERNRIKAFHKRRLRDEGD